MHIAKDEAILWMTIQGRYAYRFKPEVQPMCFQNWTNMEQIGAIRQRIFASIARLLFLPA